MSVWTGEERRKGMNGEQIVAEIDSRLGKLEIRFEERWKNHDTRAEDIQAYTCKKIEDVKGSIENLWQTVNSLDKNVVEFNALMNEKFVSLDKTTVLMATNLNNKIIAFEPVRKITYGLVAIILTGFVSGLLFLVFK